MRSVRDSRVTVESNHERREELLVVTSMNGLIRSFAVCNILAFLVSWRKERELTVLGPAGHQGAAPGAVVPDHRLLGEDAEALLVAEELSPVRVAGVGSAGQQGNLRELGSLSCGDDVLGHQGCMPPVPVSVGDEARWLKEAEQEEQRSQGPHGGLATMDEGRPTVGQYLAQATKYSMDTDKKSCRKTFMFMSGERLKTINSLKIN